MAKEDRIGGLWKPKTDNERAPLYKGNLKIRGETFNIVVWGNRWKQEGEKTPDAYIEIDAINAEYRPPLQPQALQEGATARAEAKAKDRREGVGSKPVVDDFTDDVPF